MAIILNEIIINAPIGKVWQALAEIDWLGKYDPTVKRSIALTEKRSGVGAKRKVEMLDGKNWFEERVTEFKVNEALAFELTACSFPIHKLQHSYSFMMVEGKTQVKQVMQYTVKFGLLGRLLDLMMIRKQSDAGVKKFFAGLKTFAEKTD